MKKAHKLSFALMMSILPLVQSAQAEILQINKSQFEFQRVENENAEGFKQQLVELYRVNGSAKSQKILSHTMQLETGDDSILSVELGDYEVKGNQIIFYQYWATGDKQGLWTYPYGVRKQTYTVDAQGKVKLSQAVMYVEDIISDPLKEDPEQYLNIVRQSAQTLQQQKILKQYVDSMQERYHARFVYGQEKQQLIQEVKRKLAKPIAKATAGWKADFGNLVHL